MNQSIRLSIIVPCFNEAKNIKSLLDGFASVLQNDKDVELILVDNGSTDDTGRVIDRIICEKCCAFARKITVAKNQGYGFGILSGIKEAQGEVLAWTHADLQAEPADIFRAYQYYQRESEINPKILVKGFRQNRKFTEKIFSVGMQLFASFVLGVWLTEVNAQPKLFPRSLYSQMKNAPDDFSLDLYILWVAKHSHYRIVSMPVYFKSRFYGEAKGGGGSFKNRWKLICRTLSYIIELKRKINMDKA